jgi:hypothetical protein
VSPVIPGRALRAGPESITTTARLDSAPAPDSVSQLRLPHPEERRLRRVSKDGPKLMVRDGASAPPHHEARNCIAEQRSHKDDEMNPHLPKLALAALLLATPAFTAFAEDAPAPAAPAAAQSETPASVPRPSIVPKAAAPAPTTAQPAPSSATAPSTAATDATPDRPRPRRTAHRHHRRYGAYYAGYFGPFRVYWPQVHWPRVHWHRVAWGRWW